MSKIYFQLGVKNHVKISLPSKLPSDGSIFVGKAKVQVSSLSCSEGIKIHQSDLTSFFTQVEKVYQTLKGKFTFKSDYTYSAFTLFGEVTKKGQIRITVKIGYPIRNLPDYTEWQAEAVFNCEPEELKRLIDSQRTT